MDNYYFLGIAITILSMIGWFFVKNVGMQIVTIFIALGTVYIGGTQQSALTFPVEFFNLGLGTVILTSLYVGIKRVNE